MKYTPDDRFHRELNFRDFGGYPANDHRTVKRGIFYRSGALSFMTPEEFQVFQSLGVRCVIDFRTDHENERHPDPELHGVEVYRCSGVVSKGGEGIDFSPRGMNQMGEAGEEQLRVLTQYYKEMPFGNEAYRIMIEQLEKNNVPICLHCATGKDRTGIAAMIVLLLLDVPEEIVLEDYLLSGEYRQSIVQRSLAQNAERIQASPVLKELLIMKDGVSETIGRMVLQNMHERYGSYEEYFRREFGITQEIRQKLQERFLE